MRSLIRHAENQEVPHCSIVHNRQIVMSSILIPLFLFVSGCSTDSSVNTTGITIPVSSKEHNVKRFFVFGFGLVSVKAPSETNTVMIADQTSLGVYGGNLPGLNIGLGYQSSTVTAISDPDQADDVRVEVTRESFNRVNVTAESVDYNKEKNKEELSD